jgi:hypothetical protein
LAERTSPTACWSLKLAEKINNYLNILRIGKSSQPPPSTRLPLLWLEAQFPLMRRIVLKDAGCGRQNVADPRTAEYEFPRWSVFHLLKIVKVSSIVADKYITTDCCCKLPTIL